MLKQIPGKHNAELAPKPFLPAKRSLLDDAMANLAEARCHFSGRGTDATLIDVKLSQKALSACSTAILGWRMQSRQCAANSREKHEALLTLGELHYLKGMACKAIYSSEDGRELSWFLRAARSFEKAASHWGRAARTGAGMSGTDAAELGKNLWRAHDEASYAYLYASICLSEIKNPFIDRKLLASQPGKAGEYGKKAISHNEKSGKYGLIALPGLK